MFDGLISDSFVMEQELWYLHRDLLEDMDMKSLEQTPIGQIFDFQNLQSQRNCILLDLKKSRWVNVDGKFFHKLMITQRIKL